MTGREGRLIAIHQSTENRSVPPGADGLCLSTCASIQLLRPIRNPVLSLVGMDAPEVIQHVILDFLLDSLTALEVWSFMYSTW